MTNFFRKDLNLNKKRWHRFIKVIWYMILLILIGACLWLTYEEYDAYRFFYSDRAEYQGSILERASNKVEDIRDYLYSGEYISLEDRGLDIYYDFKSSLLDFPRDAVLCSKKWTKEMVTNLRIQYPKIAFMDGKNTVYALPSDIAAAINQPCVLKLSDKSIQFNILGDDLYIYNIVTPNKFEVTMKWLFPCIWKSLLACAVYLCITMLIYYKGILYIIYGTSKNKKKSD